MKKLFTPIALFFAVVIGTFAQSYEIKVIDESLPLNIYSNNGKYLGGSLIGNCKIYNTHTGELFAHCQIEGEDENVFKAIADDGTAFGTSGKEGKFRPAYYKNGTWTYLPLLDGGVIGDVLAANPDGSIIAGYVAMDEAFSQPTPILWVKENNEYKLVELPFEMYDYFGLKAQHTMPIKISNDGNVILGRFTGAIGPMKEVLPVLWVKQEDGSYLLKKDFGENLYYNKEVDIPLSSDFYDNYENWNAQYELIRKPITPDMYAADFVQNDSKILSSASFLNIDYSNFPNIGFKHGMNIVLINTEDGSYTLIEDPNYPAADLLLGENPTPMYAAKYLSDGTILAGLYVKSAYFVSEGIVYKPGEVTSIKYEDWLNEKFNINIFDNEGILISGFPFASGNESLIGGGYEKFTYVSYLTYYILEVMPSVTDLSAIQNDENVELTWVAPNAENIKSYSVYCDGNLLSVVSDTSYTDATEREPGTYTYSVVVNYEGDKISKDEYIEVDITGSGIKDNSNVPEIKVYPNPAKDFVIVDCPKQIEKIDIINLAGVVVNSINNPATTINVESYPEGVYIFKFHDTENNVSVKHIVIRR